MAWRMGLLGKKVGMIQDFDDKGNWAAYTVVECGPCVILDIKTQERDGYWAIQLGYDEQKAHRVNRPRMGIFAKAKTDPKRIIREVRLSKEEVEQFEVGQVLTPEQVFRAGDRIDVTATSKGKGFQGVMKKYNYAGFKASHGAHEYFRHGGSIGCRLTPGRVPKGRKMPGQMGNKQVTTQNLSVNEILTDRNVVLVKGAVPGAPGGYVTISHAMKTLRPSFALLQPAPQEEAAAEVAEA